MKCIYVRYVICMHWLAFIKDRTVKTDRKVGYKRKAMKGIKHRTTGRNQS